MRLPAVIGHRGAAARAPENTLAGLRAAHACGASWVEVDVKLSRDGVLVLFHDDTLERTSDGHGPLAACDWAALARYDAGAWFDQRFRGEEIPTLAQAVTLMAALGLGANLEIKPCPGREAETGAATAAWVRTHWPAILAPPLLSSFSDVALAAARSVHEAGARALNVRALPRDWRRRIDIVGADAIHADQRRIGVRVPAKLRTAGIALRCYTVNDPARAAALFARGVESVFTDDPTLILPAVPR